MYSHLSKKEKRKRLAQARKRALLWSIQQQTVANLRKSSSYQQQSTLTHSVQTSKRDNINLKTPETHIHTDLSLPQNKTKTIQSIQNTLADLHKQRDEIDITINVLQHRLKSLQVSKTKTPR